MSTTEPLRKTVTVEEAARMIGIGRSAAYRLVRTGELRSVRIGHRIVIPLKAIDELLAA
ncbi:helix-turn-helix domain-containing protein [Propionimicrobium sp. PCR01-08-3]|uniref:helix-turn-helix domain-containing protein n=1 Tax=Propionimicrobium sp. PCR01-08-3 TaxID=3052086 RepID=UPI003341E791